MFSGQKQSFGDKPASTQHLPGPALSLPKGGGAIRGIGEKFTANPVTGTGSWSVPIATSPARSGFGPQLSLSYDSGSGNGPFGIGWNLSLPAITRKTDKGLPRYQDAQESDVFILSGAEDMVPAFKRNSEGTVLLDSQGLPIADEAQRDGYIVKQYRPRVEGLFARIERWTRGSDGDAHWRSITKDNILTVYGTDMESRIADPASPDRVFSWLICQSFDDKGNTIAYTYAAENDDNVDLSRVDERNRVRSAHRYVKDIRYGNRQPLLIDATLPSFRKAHVPAPDFTSADWMFEVVFDYGEGHYQESAPDFEGRIFATASLEPNGTRPVRLDPFSSYRSCFEVRQYRLCRRVLFFHHFPGELGEKDYLVRSTEFSYAEKLNGSFITSAAQSGYKKIAASYLKGSLPPIEFSYSASPLDDLTFDQLPVLDVEAVSLENLPAGIDSNQYRWVDLNGEGISGVLTEDAGAWFYKPNRGGGNFGPVERVSPIPRLAALNSGRQQLLDLAADGNLDLVDFASATKGFFSRNDDASWGRFKSFAALPNIDWQDANLRFLDLTGDGQADVLLTEDQAFSTWFESHGEEGFGAGVHVARLLNEEDGPRLVFADGTQSIYVADMSGDGLSDLVRLRVGEVSYWPNVGYGRFGAKVTLSNVPCFDDAESFDQRRVRLTDTDGSGPTDIIYLGRDGIRVYLNQHGNSLSDARLLDRVPPVGNLTTISVVDFLGRGTACLLWSSPLPADARRPLRYLDLMGGVKPHLLVLVRNNLGSETRLEYKSSTEYYLADKAAGAPWVTRLPFPVHVISRVETNDLISGNRFSTIYSYHHGYFDGFEREFRGFGRVEQQDTEEFGTLAPASSQDQAFHVPPALTKTWFHTGAYFATGERVSRQFESEYFGETKAAELADTVLPADLADDERREAVRSLKGAILRQEIYAADGKPESAVPYSVSERNYTVEFVQPASGNRHSVFFTHARETIDFHYERNAADPRITHSVNLAVDAFGNVLRSAGIAYGRRLDDADPLLTAADKSKQKQPLVTLTEANFTNVVVAADAYRAPLPAEVTTYELVKLAASELVLFDDLAAAVATARDGAHDLPYEDVNAAGALGTGPFRRPIERTRTRYRANNLAQLLPLNALESLAVAGENYKLALTAGLLSATFQRPHLAKPAENLLPNPGAVLRADAVTWVDRGGYVDLDDDGNWWIPSGRVFFHADAKASASTELDEAVGHFFLQRRFRDPFQHDTVVEYVNDLLPAKTTDALGNVVEALHDFRVLQPARLTDPNGNRSFVVFDAFGLPAASAVSGKPSESVGDSVGDFADLDANLSLAQLQKFVANPQAQAPSLLKSATSRFVYDLDRFRRCGEPPFAATLARETHIGDARPLKIQLSFAYSDGFGRELQSKIPAEPGEAALRDANVPIAGEDIGPGALKLDHGGNVTLGSVDPRWVGKGRTVYNNKGKPVKQYEPFFSSTHLYEPEPEMTDAGVASILFYDPMDRVVATLHPNHTYEKIVFDPWRQETWDVNDTVAQSDPKLDSNVGEFFQLLPVADYLPTWHDQRRNGQKGADEKSAAEKAAAHAGTPAVMHFDTLGRAMLTIADNGPGQEFATRVVLDIEGNQREVIDAKNRSVMRYDYDLLGSHIAQASMEAGHRWMLNDVAGNPIRGWDSRDHSFRTEYDELRRHVRSFAVGADSKNAALETCFEVTVYGETAGLSAAQLLTGNLRGRMYQHFDTAGVVTNTAYDFKGNLLGSTRQLTKDYKTPPDWLKTPALAGEVFASATSYDALNRPIQLIAPHSDGAGAKVNVLQPGYNEANLLERTDVWLARAAVAGPVAILDPKTADLSSVSNIDYNAKGQRTRIDFGNGASTEYAYDEQTFRLIHLKTSRTSGAPSRSVFQDLFYTFDPAGNMTHIRDDAQQTIYFNNQVVPPICDFVYDPTYRLTQAIGREHIGQLAQPQTNWDDEFRRNLPLPTEGVAMRRYTEQYFYDAVGNFDRVVHQAVGGNWTRTYNYNEASMLEAGKTNNRLSSTAVGSTTESYTFDAHGNMTAMPHLTLMQWDFKDQLGATSRQSVAGAGNTAETTYYVYDSAGERARKVTERQGGTTKEERIYLGAFEVYREFASTGTAVALERETLHVMDDKRRVALVETRTQGSNGSPAQLVRYQFGNHLGSASLELDDAGTVISYEEYFPYGSTSYQAVDLRIKAAAKRYRYTGKERDEETGFGYHGARYYAPWLGRWLSCDPISLIGSINFFNYASANPIAFVDSNGQEPRKAGNSGDVDRHTDQGLRGKGTPGALESEHLDPIAVQRESLRNPATGESPIPPGRGSAIDKAQPTVLLDKKTADAKTRLDKTVIAKVKAESKAGTVTSATASEVGSEAGLARALKAAEATNTTVPAGAHAAAIGQIDALHADPAVRSFARNAANNPLVGATDAEISAASNPQKAGSLTSLAATTDPGAETVFKGNYSQGPLKTATPPAAKPAAASPPAGEPPPSGGKPSSSNFGPGQGDQKVLGQVQIVVGVIEVVTAKTDEKRNEGIRNIVLGVLTLPVVQAAVDKTSESGLRAVGSFIGGAAALAEGALTTPFVLFGIGQSKPGA